MTVTTHSIVRVVLLDEAAQERAGRVPVPARGREERGVERFGRLVRVRVRRDGRKVCLGLVELSRLEVHAAERGAQLAVRLRGRRRRRRRRRRLVMLLCGERLQQRRGGRKVLIILIRSWGPRDGNGAGSTVLYLDLDELRRGDQAYARRALVPHLVVRVDAGRARAAPAAAEERAEGVGVAVGVAGPVLDAGVDDVELEGEDVPEDVRARGGGRDPAQRAVQVRRLGRGLVEEAEAREGGEAEVPELCVFVSLVLVGVGHAGYTRLARGRGPLGLFRRSGRVPFGRGHASYWSSTENAVIVRPEREALTTRVWKSVLVHSPVRSRGGRLSGLDIYLVRSVVNGSVYDTQNRKIQHEVGKEKEKQKE